MSIPPIFDLQTCTEQHEMGIVDGLFVKLLPSKSNLSNMYIYTLILLGSVAATKHCCLVRSYELIYMYAIMNMSTTCINSSLRHCVDSGTGNGQLNGVSIKQHKVQATTRHAIPILLRSYCGSEAPFVSVEQAPKNNQ